MREINEKKLIKDSKKLEEFIKNNHEIKSQKINGIIELYVALSAEEKSECLRNLQNIH